MSALPQNKTRRRFNIEQSAIGSPQIPSKRSKFTSGKVLVPSVLYQAAKCNPVEAQAIRVTGVTTQR
jgi:hypothetical protein